MSKHQTHPAYYTSRRQLWISLPGSRRKCSTRFLHRLGFESNFESIADIWYTLFILCTTIWLLCLAGWRYRDFKSQANDPRFGGRWDQETSLYVQLSSIIIALALLPIMMCASICRSGHIANDSIQLGHDLVHLHNEIFKLASTQVRWNSDSADGLSNVGQRGRSYSFEEEGLESLMLKRRGETLMTKVSTTLRPFSTLIYLLIVYVLLFPICVLEAEQLRNEAIHPRFALHSNLDGLLGKANLMEQISDGKFIIASDHRDDQPQTTQNERPFPSHTYPSEPPTISMEFSCLLIACCFLTIRYALPFYFTSRSFSLVFSLWTALCGLFILLDAASIAVVYKISMVGIREPGGAVLMSIHPIDRFLTAFHCLVLSALSLPAILLNLAALYIYGRDQFSYSLFNYTQLLAHGELPMTNGSQQNSKSDIPASQISGYNPTTNDACTSNSSDANAGNYDSSRDNQNGVPLTLAITTKLWRPTQSTRNKRRTSGVMGGQPNSHDSEASNTLKRANGSSANVDITASVHALTDSNESGKSKGPKRSHYGVMAVAAFSFMWLLITRICLAGPLLRCYWATRMNIIMINIVSTILFLIIWLLVWFAMGVKNAWRFRILHSLPQSWPRQSSAELRANGLSAAQYQTNLTGLGPSQQIPIGGYPTVWPYISYNPWLSNGIPGATLPVDYQQNNPHLQPIANGSDVNSLYGCLQVPTSQMGVNVDGAQYQGHVMGMNMRAGPPTLSDESDGIPGSMDPINMGRQHAKHPSTYLNLHQPNSNFVAAYDSSSRGTSPMETVNQTTFMNGVRGAPSMLKPSRIAEANEPTYATLASMNRAMKVPVRSSSAMSQLKTMAEHPPDQYLTRGASSKRNGSRVTFQDSNSEFYREGTNVNEIHQDGATASSDSGVYTNGQATSNERQSRGFKPEPPTRSRLGSHGRMRSISPRARKFIANGNSPDPDAVHLLVNTELTAHNTDFTSQQQQQPFQPLFPNVLSNSNDQLCSQV